MYLPKKVTEPPLATTSVPGISKPDGTTITIDNSGTISSSIDSSNSANLSISSYDNNVLKSYSGEDMFSKDFSAGDLIFANIGIDAAFDDQSANTSWKIQYKTRINNVTSTYQPTIRGYNGSLPRTYFNSNIPAGMWLVLKFVDNNTVDCVGEINAGGATVHTWETTTTDQSDMWLVLNLTSTPILSTGDIYEIKVKANYVGYDFQSYGTTTYGLRFTDGGSTVSWTNCISAGVDSTGATIPFTPDIHEGDVITLLCTNALSHSFLLLSSNKDKEYCEATITLSTSATTTATFYNAGITSDSVLEVGVSEWGLVPDSVSMSSTGIATAVFPAVDSARSVTVRLYIK